MLTAIASVLLAAAAVPSAGTNTAERVRVRPRTPIPVAEPTAVVAGADAVAPAKPVSSDVPDVMAVALAEMTEANVAEVMAVVMAKATGATLPAVLEAVLAKTTEAMAPAVASAVYSRLVELTTPGVQPAELIKIKAAWYDRLAAVPASRAWWLLQMAKDKASRGESVDELKKLFDAAIEAASKEDD